MAPQLQLRSCDAQQLHGAVGHVTRHGMGLADQGGYPPFRHLLAVWGAPWQETWSLMALAGLIWLVFVQGSQTGLVGGLSGFVLWRRCRFAGLCRGLALCAAVLRKNGSNRTSGRGARSSLWFWTTSVIQSQKGDNSRC